MALMYTINSQSKVNASGKEQYGSLCFCFDKLAGAIRIHWNYNETSFNIIYFESAQQFPLDRWISNNELFVSFLFTMDFQYDLLEWDLFLNCKCRPLYLYNMNSMKNTDDKNTVWSNVFHFKKTQRTQTLPWAKGP